MRHTTTARNARWLLAVALVLLGAAAVLAQSGDGYDLTWNTVDGGGGASTGETYALQGTAGQPDAGAVSGEGYTLAGGFLPGGALAPLHYRVYLPLVLRNQ